MNRRRLAPVDPVLPALGELVDDTAVVTALEPLLTRWHRRPCRVRSIAIERIKYRPGRNCIVAYVFRVEHPGEAGSIEQRVSIAMHDRAEAIARHEKAREEVRGAAHAGHVALITGWNAVVRCFPFDRKLPGLGRLAMADEALSRYLPSLVSRRWPEGAIARNATHAVVSYFPEHTCTITMSAEIASRGSQQRAAWRVFGKMRYDDAGAGTARVMEALWTSDAHRRGLVGYARPLGYDAAERLLWQEGVAAPTLHALLAADTRRPDILHRVARAVAALHRTPVVALRDDPRENVTAAIAGAAEIVARAEPALAARANALARTLEATSPGRHGASFATLHGDLHSRNILVAPERVHLIDLDRVSVGDALSELGSLLAELAYRSCVQGQPIDTRSLAHILEGYFEDGVDADVAAATAWHFAAALLHERAKRSITSLKPGWRDALPAVLELARRIIEHPEVLLPGSRVTGVAA